MQFLELYRAKASPTEPTQTEAANRLAAAIRKREGRMKPIELFSVAISSFRRRGIRQTMQRAKEWLHIRSRRGA
jgi:hypothetical protein